MTERTDRGQQMVPSAVIPESSAGPPPSPPPASGALYRDDETDDTILVPVPFDLIRDCGEEVRPGTLRLRPASEPLPMMCLSLGGHDLGVWAVAEFTAERGGGEWRYLATLRRVRGPS